ncbi:protein S-acyltransferase 7 [Tripterygium wilfordii]|uniref:S-acyltransferase n=1 Tax=Tripterygium wilfordii TaxID=458696 RepID=A0A7J7CA08_TRIWF|nr:probable protein S-acyltransferase 7 [Tripterygium wilfordii]KAF5730978.1 protein S-acyltransferase 7 [Tripterygium wilfordii]
MRETYVVPPPPSRASGSLTEAADAAGTAMIRAYRIWKGSNIFFLQGRLIFGPDVRSVLLTVFLIVAPVAVFCVFVARKLMDDFQHHLGILVMVIVVALTLFDLIVLLVTSGRDPGIVPRNAHPPEPEVYEESSGVWPGQTPPQRLPRTKDVIVNGITVKTKYCDTCMLYRPPRCSHCSICNNCVEKFDHHCPWVGQCIGLRNYRFYFMFVFTSTLLCLYIHGFCWVYITRIMDGEATSFWKAMIKTPASIALLIYSFFSVWFVGGLTALHLYLISTNQSTYENFRYRYDRVTNPHNKGVIKNFIEVFCSSIPPSKNNFRGKVPKEPEIPPRMVGGSFVSSNRSETIVDTETGSMRKTVRDEAAKEVGDNESRLSDDIAVNVDVKWTDESSNLPKFPPKDGTQGNEASYHRISSWGRKNWEVASEIGDSKWAADGNSSNLRTEDPQSCSFEKH